MPSDPNLRAAMTGARDPQTSGVVLIRPTTLDDLRSGLDAITRDLAKESVANADLRDAVGACLLSANAASRGADNAAMAAAAARSEASQAKALAARACEAATNAEDEARAARDDVADLSEHVIALEIGVGRAPDPAALARASSVDLSPEEVARLDAAAKLGTGLHRRLSDLEIRFARRAFLGGAAGAGATQLLVHLPDLIAAAARLLGG